VKGNREEGERERHKDKEKNWRHSQIKRGTTRKSGKEVRDFIPATRMQPTKRYGKGRCLSALQW